MKFPIFPNDNAAPIECSFFVGGTWGVTDRFFQVYSPSKGKVIANVAAADADVASQAVETASSTFEVWRRTTPYVRSELLKAWHAAMLEHIEGLALTISMEMGKPIQEARGEVRYAASFIELYAREVLRTAGDVIPSHAGDKRLASWHQPVGPVYAITPWNFPAAMITRKLAPALGAGCTAIVKPAEQSPLTALYLAWLWERSEAQPGRYRSLQQTILWRSQKSCLTMPVFGSSRLQAALRSVRLSIGSRLTRSNVCRWS